MRHGLWNQTDAAYACGVSDAQWRYYTKVGYLPRPTHSFGRRCYYTRQEVDEMKKLFVAKDENRLTITNTAT